jgi:hypothetical protein
MAWAPSIATCYGLSTTASRFVASQRVSLHSFPCVRAFLFAFRSFATTSIAAGQLETTYYPKIIKKRPVHDFTIVIAFTEEIYIEIIKDRGKDAGISTATATLSESARHPQTEGIRIDPCPTNNQKHTPDLRADVFVIIYTAAVSQLRHR